MKNKEQDNVIYFDKNAHKTINKKRLIGLIILLLIILLIVITYICMLQTKILEAT